MFSIMMVLVSGISVGEAGGRSREMMDGLRLPISLGSWISTIWDSVVSCVLVEHSLSESLIAGFVL